MTSLQGGLQDQRYISRLKAKKYLTYVPMKHGYPLSYKYDFFNAADVCIFVVIASRSSLSSCSFDFLCAFCTLINECKSLFYLRFLY